MQMCRPGQGPDGTNRTAFILMDAALCSDSGIPSAALPDVGNLLFPTFASVPSDGSLHGTPEAGLGNGLLQSLAAAAAAIRAGVQQKRQSGAALQVCMPICRQRGALS